MIPKYAVKAFLFKPRRDVRKYKRFSKKKLQRLMRTLPERPPIWSKLRLHQKVCVLLGAKYKHFAFFLDMGCGKTLVSIALIRYFLERNQIKRTLVVVPYKPNGPEWLREVRKHSPSLKAVVLKGSTAEKWETLESTDASVVIVTYGGLLRMVCSIVPAKKRGTRLKRDPKAMKRLQKLIDSLVLDESTEAQNHQSLAFGIFRQLRKINKFTLLLTGTPFDGDPKPLWGQMFLVDRGESFGKTLGLFRAAFYNEKDNYWSGGKTYTFKPHMKKHVTRLLAHSSVRYKADDADLPGVQEHEVQVHLTTDADVYYEKAKDMLKLAGSDAKLQENIYLRMRQISSGFIGYKNDETGERAKFVFPRNPKMEALVAKLQPVVDQHKSIVFHDFLMSGNLIADELKKLKVKYAMINGKTKDVERELLRFTENDDYRVCILNTAGAFGLNLQIARYGFFYESPPRLKHRLQMQRRYIRQYSPWKAVFMLDFIVRGTVDEKIRIAHREGREFFAAIVDRDE